MIFILGPKITMEFEIDSESRDHVFESLCNGFSCKLDDLENILLGLDIEQIYEENWKSIDIPADEYLYQHTIQILGNHKPLKKVNWFHLTRTTKQNDFEDGIIPLGGTLERIWTTLISIPTEPVIKDNLNFLKNNGVPDFHYRLKHNDQFHWGPYAVLVKETAFNASDLSQHDYLGMPEIIEDICNGYEERFGDSIIEIYESSLVPKIVKFQSHQRLDSGCVEAALFYAYELVRGNPPSSNCVTCFDGEGIKIEPSSVISVTTVEKQKKEP